MIYLSILFLLADIFIASARREKLPGSVSECFYANGWLHYFLLVGAALTMMPTMITHTPDNLQFLAFFSCAALVFVATAPNYLDDSQHVVHSVSAIICAACAVAWAALVVPAALISIVILAPAIRDKKHRLLWLEMSAFATAYAGAILLSN